MIYTIHSPLKHEDGHYSWLVSAKVKAHGLGDERRWKRFEDGAISAVRQLLEEHGKKLLAQVVLKARPETCADGTWNVSVHTMKKRSK